jgi:hypothetical protein
MQIVTARPIPVIKTTGQIYDDILLADHVLIIADTAPAPGASATVPAAFAARRCLLSRSPYNPSTSDSAHAEPEFLQKMVGG